MEKIYAWESIKVKYEFLKKKFEIWLKDSMFLNYKAIYIYTVYHIAYQMANYKTSLHTDKYKLSAVKRLPPAFLRTNLFLMFNFILLFFFLVIKKFSLVNKQAF